MYIYRVSESTVYDEDREICIKRYGIAALDETGKILKFSDSVFEDRKNAERLAEACNKGELDIIHLNDVVEDALID